MEAWTIEQHVFAYDAFVCNSELQHVPWYNPKPQYNPAIGYTFPINNITNKSRQALQEMPVYQKTSS